jgi:hypothetical protein
MSATITFFPVGNGDMTLIKLADGETRVLIDVNIRGAADDPNDSSTHDVAKDLRNRLRRDSRGRPYVDAFLLSHPDQDHCNGLRDHFWLGKPADYPDDKKKDDEKRIIIREIWSSPLVFRRASVNHTLCDDAKAFNAEARRRVKVNRDMKFSGVMEGDRILILGEDEDGKTDDLGPILVLVDQEFDRINWSKSACFRARLLAPLSKGDEKLEESLSKNHSSTILNIQLAADKDGPGEYQFLTAGDAEVAIWEYLWAKHKQHPEVLQYNLLLTPHHCSWHSLSYDSWSEKGDNAVVSQAARSALSQTRVGAILVASSDPIKDDDNDPPCYGAKKEYEKIARSTQGGFVCTGEYPTTSAPAPLELVIDVTGLTLATPKASPVPRSLKPAVVASSVTFPNRQVMPNKPAGFA